VPGPCAYTPTGQVCTFDTRTFINDGTTTGEQISAYGRFFKYDVNQGYAPAADNGRLLANIGRWQ
jgi:hypothetical protein